MWSWAQYKKISHKFVNDEITSFENFADYNGSYKLSFNTCHISLSKSCKENKKDKNNGY